MILHRDDLWLVVDKPAGLATHAPRPGELGAVEWLELHLGWKLHVVSRLDRDTSGVLLLARTPAASAVAEKIHEAGAATKVYEFLSDADCLASGHGPEWSCANELDGKPAETVFRRLGAVDPGPAAHHLYSPGRAAGPLFHYRAEIARGRRHQIRRHASATGVPILGDSEYGGATWPRVCLHCAEVRWPGLDTPLPAELPPSFRAVLGGSATAAELDFALCCDRRGAWLPSITDAQRLVHRGEIDSLPVSIDVFRSWFHAVWYDETTSAAEREMRLAPLLDLIAEQRCCSGGIVRVHRSNPHQRQLVAEPVVVGQAPPDRFRVTEHGLKYEISLTRTQHPGLFLDQRDSRRRIARLAAGRRLANLFAYTCSFSVAAAAAGAEVAFSVDVAKPCLNTGKTNFELNGLTEGGRGKFIQEDARRWLQRQQRRRTERPGDFSPLDLIVCDPPVFASSKDGGKFMLEKEWPRLVSDAADLLAPDGAALFANNHQAGDEKAYLRALRERFGEVVAQRPPLDFPVLGGRPPHVRIYLCSQPIRD